MKSFTHRFFTAFLAVCLVLPMITVGTSAAEDTKKRSIAVVFDNSGSMYTDFENGKYIPKKIWSRATYSMEVFASMMNKGDTLYVHPMNPIDVKGNNYTSQTPLIITDPHNANIIRDIITNDAIHQDTPIESIDYAEKQLLKSDGEKWLIVLTDGNEFYENNLPLGTDTKGKTGTKYKLEERLNSCSDEFNVLYLGIGKDVVKPNFTGSNMSKTFVAEDSKDILAKLTEMCNLIFGRDAVPDVSGDFNIDVSMKKMIVFAQGKNISGVSLSNTSGNGAGDKDKEDISTKYPPEFEEVLKGEKVTIPTDTDLQGMIVTYKNSPKGKYQIKKNGTADSVCVYYEPDVDLMAELIDSDGNVMKSGSEIPAGNYTLRYGLMDKQTKEMSQSELLKNPKYTGHYTINGAEEKISTNGKLGETSIYLPSGAKFDAEITVEYLSGLPITKTTEELGLNNNITDRDPEKFEAKFSGGQDTYHLSEMQNEHGYEVEVYYGGEKLTGEELKKVEFSDDVDGLDFNVNCENDKCIITPAYPDQNHPENTTCGPLTPTIKATYKPKDCKTATSDNKVEFTVENDIKGLSAKINLPKERFTVSEIGKSVFYIDLRMGGEKLTAADMDNIESNITISDDGKELKFTVEKDVDNSRLVIKLDGDGAGKGDYKVTSSVTGKDALGNDTVSTDEADFRVRLLPVWAVCLIIFLILAAIAALIWYILSRKVLPKRVFVNSTVFVVNGEQIAGDASVTYNDGGKSKGTVTINSPRHPTNPLAKCNITLSVAASDTRYKYLKAKLRKNYGSLTMKRTSIRSSRCIDTVNMCGVTDAWDEHHQLIVNPANMDDNTGVLISSEDSITINGMVMDENGYSAALFMTVIIRFE